MLQMRAKLLMVNSFAAGILITAGICAAFYFFGDNSNTTIPIKTQTKTAQVSEEDMIAQLASNGFVVKTEEEWNSQLSSVESDWSKKLEAKEKEYKEQLEAVEKAESEKKDKKDSDQKVVYRTILSVTSGMTSIDVGRALVKANIIDDAMDFFNEVEKRGLANDLRPGSFEVDSEMTMNEVISTIFK